MEYRVLNVILQSSMARKTAQPTRQDTNVTSDTEAAGNSQNDGLVSV